MVVSLIWKLAWQLLVLQELVLGVAALWSVPDQESLILVSEVHDVLNNRNFPSTSGGKPKAVAIYCVLTVGSTHIWFFSVKGRDL